MTDGNRFGVVIVGDEILSGKRSDRHLPHVIEALAARDMEVVWARITGDDRRRLVNEMKQAQQDPFPVLWFGGIGITPDDQTRQAAAEAFGSRLVRHPGAVAMIEERFGDAARPVRIRMADLPEDCLLIPNPCNGVPGFTLYNHHFFPGFPDMAWPMVEWVLDSHYPFDPVPLMERSVRVLRVYESELVPLLEQLSLRHPAVKLFSLPRMAAVNSVEVGFRGRRDWLGPAFSDLLLELDKRVLRYEIQDGDQGSGALRHAVV
jgi:molybdopterin-biosynthesis enzyme MoeA-like protein